MKKPILTYIALGSNLGDKFAHLQSALQSIHDSIGKVSAVGRVYASEALGFDGPGFLNTVCVVQTRLQPTALLDALQAIEQEAGREQDRSTGYTSRTLDLDIITYGDQVINSERLIVPHPQWEQRRFVVMPLRDLIPVDQAASVNPHTADPDPTQQCMPILDRLQLPSWNVHMQKLGFVCIEGNIGAGKTSLSHLIAEEFGGKLLLERFTENPFLPLFYKDKSRYALATEMSFLTDRYQQLSDDLAQPDLFASFLVADYYIIKSLIFSRVTLTEQEYALYYKIFKVMYKEVRKPAAYVYLEQSTDRLLQNIAFRGREYEQDIDANYLTRIHSGYMQFLKEHPDMNPILIDARSLDFVHNRKDFKTVVERIR